MKLARATLIWACLITAIAVPLAAAATSPLLAWRGPAYIAAGFAGVIALGLLLVQPLLIGGYLPGFLALRGRHAHRWIGAALIMAVIIHVGGLWLTSPQDVIDALLFRSPTPFSDWGVIAMWAIFAAALLAALKRRLHLPPRIWRIGHTTLALITVAGVVVHAMLIEGTMETMTKALLCFLVAAAAVKIMVDLKVWAGRRGAR
jgi:predicted ferric reductase